MTELLLIHEPQIRLSVFLGLLVLFAVLEVAAPRRRLEIPRVLRWSNNLALVVLDTAVLRLVFPVLAVAFALEIEARGWGLLNQVALADWAALLVAFTMLDLAIYGQHILFHRVPALWRLHRMHHADLDFDVSTALRFHPVEIVVSMLIKFAVIVVLGAPAIAVLLFEVVLSGAAMFNHANIRLAPALDRILRQFIVTPDMHRVHHSVIPKETHSNFGFNLSVWDRLFGTYRAQPSGGHKGMTIGLPVFRARRELWLDRMLYQPLRHDKDDAGAENGDSH